MSADLKQEFRALVVRRSQDRRTFTRAIEKRRIEELPAGDLLIRVHYSSLNYKDGLSCIGNPGVTRRYPHTPGIDAAGIVNQSNSPEFKVGDEIIIAGTALGMDISGGFGEFIRIPSAWAVPLPTGMTLRESMIWGTAGFTAALSVLKLQQHGLQPSMGPVIVTGASGGVGSVSVALLAKLGFQVTAISGKSKAQDFLRGLGAHDVQGRELLQDTSDRPLLKELWAGGIDTVGGVMLANVIKSCKENTAIAATGLVGSQDLPISVLPFILRGVSLLGINAQGLTPSARRELWLRLAREWKLEKLESLAIDCRLDDLDPQIDKILAGGQQGRVVVDMR
jgi:putative YhdH/YhfP family quinone oxidoreductase